MAQETGCLCKPDTAPIFKGSLHPNKIIKTHFLTYFFPTSVSHHVESSDFRYLSVRFLPPPNTMKVNAGPRVAVQGFDKFH